MRTLNLNDATLWDTYLKVIMSPRLSGLIGLNVHPMCWGINKLKSGWEVLR